MDYIKQYKSFINSHNLTEGIRITAGVVLPAVAFSYFDMLAAGVVVSLGAMCVSVTDNPGPIVHRRNGMLICILIIFVVSLLTGFASSHPVVLGSLICIFCFVFSIIGVYGSRAISIGVAALLVMVLNIERQQQGLDVAFNAVYVAVGGLWYTMLSLILYSIRPYKLVQQALGDCILATSDYLRTRASLYDKQVNYEKTYQQMLEQQVAVHEKQELVRELLFKSRDIVKESTNTGRTLVVIFTDIVDLFERAMTAYEDYELLHKYFDNSDILRKYQQLILELAKQLDDIGLAVKSGSTSEENDLLHTHIRETQDYFEELRDTSRTPENIEAFISLRQILNGIEDIARRIHTLHLYTTYDKKFTKNFPTQFDYDKFITHEHVDFRLLKDNLTLKSSIFRHSLRVTIATIAGYIVSWFLPVGHSYWILLTIIVILKPAYSLTKKRNYQRLLGTIAGAVIGSLILYFIKDKTFLFVLMLFFMIGTYSFLRRNYLAGVFLMTPYILILFHLLFGSNLENILFDRVIDTGIGSFIAFVANIFLFPSWEHEQIRKYMVAVIEDNTNYFKDVSQAFIGKPISVFQYKLSRKNAFVSLANLSDAFSRMLEEPKSKQKNIRPIHEFVVMNHMLTSHIATLSYYVKPMSKKYATDDFTSVIRQTISQLEQAKAILNKEPVDTEKEETRRHIINDRVNGLLEKRRQELQQGLIETETRIVLSELKPIVDQFNFILGIAADIKKLAPQV